MSAVCLKLITILCLCCAALSGSGSSGVIWKDFGGSVTIQCRSPEPNQEYMILNKGLNEDFQVLYKEKNSEENPTAPEFSGRLQLDGVFPNMDILIKNLTLDDTGPYWCKYKRFDMKTSQPVTKRGPGSVLLVVTEPQKLTADSAQQCDPSNKNLVLVSVVISAAVLIGIVMGFLMWIIFKTKALRTTVRPRRVTTNDVYEDMRGTIRR